MTASPAWILWKLAQGWCCGISNLVHCSPGQDSEKKFRCWIIGVKTPAIMSFSNWMLLAVLLSWCTLGVFVPKYLVYAGPNIDQNCSGQITSAAPVIYTGITYNDTIKDQADLNKRFGNCNQIMADLTLSENDTSPLYIVLHSSSRLKF